MPSKSPAQARTMAAIAHGWKPPASSGIHIPTSVAKEYNAADKGGAMLRQRVQAQKLRERK